MEVIQKTILLEEGKSHLPGFLPFLSGVTEENIGNYKSFVYDIDFSCLSGDTMFNDLAHLGKMSYVTMMNKYYALMKFYKDCTYYRPIIKRGEVSWVKTVDFSCEERYIGNLINEDIQKKIFKLGYKIPDVIFLPDFDSISAITPSQDCVVGINEKLSTDSEIHWDNPYEILTFEEYENLGGLLFYVFVTRATGKIFVPEDINGSLVPNYIYLEAIAQELSDMKVLSACIDKRKFYEMGGYEYIHFLEAFDEEYIQSEKEYFANLFGEGIPTINIPISLNITYDDLGIMEVYSKNWVQGRMYYVGDIVFYDEESYICTTPFGVEDELSLQDIKALSDFEYALEKGYWEPLITKDEDKEKEFITYKAESQLLSLKNPRLAVDDDGNEYQGYFRYDEAGRFIEELGPMFSVNKPKNIFISLDSEGNNVYWGDMILDIEKSGDTYYFRYVLGGKLLVTSATTDGVTTYEYSYDEDSQTGLIYEETYKYEHRKETILLNEDENTHINYDYIDFDSYRVSVENLAQGVIFSNVTHSVDDIYDIDENGKARLIQSTTFRTGKELGIAEKKIWINTVDINRGSNAAFENFYRLTEVNTFSDLANYQNNYFNLEDN